MRCTGALDSLHKEVQMNAVPVNIVSLEQGRAQCVFKSVILHKNLH